MKKLLIVIVILATLAMTGCASDNVNRDKAVNSGKLIEKIDSRFIDTGDDYAIDGGGVSVYYDSKTNIVYLFNGGYQQGGITPFLGSDKQPMTIDEYNASR